MHFLKALAALLLFALAACGPTGPTSSAPHPDQESGIELTALTFESSRFVGRALISFDSRDPQATTPPLRITGTSGELNAIDYHPNGTLYGIAYIGTVNADRRHILYALNPATGAATEHFAFIAPFIISDIAFQAAGDIMQLLSSDGARVARLDISTAELSAVETLSYATGDPNEGEDINITALSYTPDGRLLLIAAPSQPGTDVQQLVQKDPPESGPLGTLATIRGATSSIINTLDSLKVVGRRGFAVSSGIGGNPAFYSIAIDPAFADVGVATLEDTLRDASRVLALTAAPGQNHD